MRFLLLIAVVVAALGVDAHGGEPSAGFDEYLLGDDQQSFVDRGFSCAPGLRFGVACRLEHQRVAGLDDVTVVAEFFGDRAIALEVWHAAEAAPEVRRQFALRYGAALSCTELECRAVLPGGATLTAGDGRVLLRDESYRRASQMGWHLRQAQRRDCIDHARSDTERRQCEVIR